MDQGNLVHVYSKARKNDALIKILADMKKAALKETKIAYAAKGIEPDQFDRRELGNQQGLLETTAKECVTDFCGSLTQPKLTLRRRRDQHRPHPRANHREEPFRRSSDSGPVTNPDRNTAA